MNYIPVRLCLCLCDKSSSKLFFDIGNNLPKQFVKISNEYSLLQNNILHFISESHIILVSNIRYKNILLFQIRELIDLKILLPNIKFTIFLEPINRNSLPAITIICDYFINKKLLFFPCERECERVYNTNYLLKSIQIGLDSLNNN